MATTNDDLRSGDEHRWVATHTVHPNRRNIFSLKGTDAYHVGTLVSGSRSRLSRFDQDVELIAAAPELRCLLEQAGELLTEHPELRARITATLQRIRSSRRR